VDDCSADNTYREAVALGLPIIQTPCNMGPGGARNYGVEHMSGDWVHILDADDLLSAAVLSQNQQFLDDSFDVLLLGARWVDGNNGELLKEWRFESKDVVADPLFSP